MNRSTVLDNLPISASDFVVEIGAGPMPFRHTKLIVDKYPFDNSERHGDIANVAPVIKADAARLPLADAACDVLFVSHVLEHIDEPRRFLEEARRCAKRIYLEFPTALREMMYAWPFHRWLIEVQDGQLVFYRNDVPQLFGSFFHDHYDFLLDQWSQQRFEELNTHLFVQTNALSWTMASQSAFEHVVQRSASGNQKVDFTSVYARTGVGKVPYGLRSRLKTALWAHTPAALLRARHQRRCRRNAGRFVPLGPDVLGRLACQKCRADALAFGDDLIVCGECGQQYRSQKGVFDFEVGIGGEQGERST